jgi:hypothetical protein
MCATRNKNGLEKIITHENGESTNFYRKGELLPEK